MTVKANEAAEILREAERLSAPTGRHIDYAEMNRVLPAQRAALTRAVKSGNLDKLVLVIRDAVRAWDRIGAWPDDWARWQRALDDARPWHAPYVDIQNLA